MFKILISATTALSLMFGSTAALEAVRKSQPGEPLYEVKTWSKQMQSSFQMQNQNESVPELGVGDQTQNQIQDQTQEQSRDQLRDQNQDQTRDQLQDHTKDQIQNQTRDQLRDQTQDQLQDQNQGQVRDQSQNQLRSHQTTTEPLLLNPNNRNGSGAGKCEAGCTPSSTEPNQNSNGGKRH